MRDDRSSGARPPGVADRAIAWIALIAAGFAVAALVLLVFRNAVALLIALVLLAVAGGAGWIALTRHGVIRAVAAVAAVGALVGVAVALIAYHVVGELVVLLAAYAVFALAARWSLRRRREREAVRPPLHQPHRRASSHAVLLMNPRSGGGKVGRFDLNGEARRRGIEPVMLEPGDDLRELARDAARSADVMGMAGGDGSQALVAQVAMEHGLDYVCVPAGTRNHLALDLGLDREDVVGALDAFTGGPQRQVDLAFVNGKIFVNNVSLGAYAQIVQSDAYRDAKRETVEEMLPDLVGPEATPFDLRFRGPDGDERRAPQVILVSNNPYMLDKPIGRGSRPRLDSGKLGIVAVEIAGAVEAAELVSLDTLGQIQRFDGWLDWTAEAFEVSSASSVAAGIDGEATMLEPPLHFTIAAKALTVRLPPSAPGLSPAALDPGPGRATLRDLWDVANSHP